MARATNEPRGLTIKEAANVLKISEKKLLKRIKEGSLYAEKKNGEYFIPCLEINRIRLGLDGE